MKRRPFTGDLVLLGCTAVWGATFVTVKDALEGADPFTFLALRFGLGALAAGLFAGPAVVNPTAWRRGTFLGLLLFAGYAFQTVGLGSTTPSRSAFITGLCVIFVPFVAWALFKRRPAAAALVGAAVAVVGLWWLTDATWEAPSTGDALTLACAVVYAFHITFTERLSVAVPPVAMVAVQLAVVAGLSAASLPFVERRVVASTELFAAVAVTGIICSAAAISLQTWAQARTTSTRAAIIFALEPVFAVAYEAALGRQGLTAHEWLGGGLIVAGVMVASVGPAAAGASDAPPTRPAPAPTP